MFSKNKLTEIQLFQFFFFVFFFLLKSKNAMTSLSSELEAKLSKCLLS